MATYLITGVSRSIGFEFLRQISADPSNTVDGLVRDKDSTDKTVAKELNQSNIHIIQADMTDYASLKRVSPLVDGSLDYIIANAGLVPSWSAYDPIGFLGNDPSKLEQELLDCFKVNVIGNIHLFNPYVPLIRNGRAKKIITLFFGMADIDLTVKYEVDVAAPYVISKAAMNTTVAEFSAQCAKEGILFMNICPGSVETGIITTWKSVAALGAKFNSYAAHFTGPSTPEKSVGHMILVINKASLEAGYGGSFISHLGTKQWL